jgi:hypothetical protein
LGDLLSPTKVDGEGNSHTIEAGLSANSSSSDKFGDGEATSLESCLARLSATARRLGSLAIASLRGDVKGLLSGRGSLWPVTGESIVLLMAECLEAGDERSKPGGTCCSLYVCKGIADRLRPTVYEASVR